MIVTIGVIWFISVGILSLYHVLIFVPKANTGQIINDEKLPGASIIIAIRNKVSLFLPNLMEIIRQNYEDFEIIIADDHSELGERKILDQFVSSFSKVKIVKAALPGKKNALRTGAHAANFDILLFTDADCIPASADWIRTMVSQSTKFTIVLGYSPYLKMKGWLNALIRFETVMTGIQYMSWTMKDRPYMAVGRNVLYPQSLLMISDSYQKFGHVPYGDDDLGLQTMSKNTSVKVCIDPGAFMISMPATSWGQWLKQKHRHLSASHYYKPSLLWQPALYGVSIIIHWLFLPFIIFFFNWWLWVPVFAIGLLIRWLNYFYWTKKLGDRDTTWKYLLLE
ncbi:MAG: glycosyltransferase, partial [Saprospiraceae bacterium]